MLIVRVSAADASPGVKYYLIAYNAFSSLAWSYVLITLTLHLLGFLSTSSATGNTATQRVHSASARLSSLFSSSLLPTFSKSGSTNVKSKAFFFSAKFLQPLVKRMSNTYASVGPETTLVQSVALLEVVHAYLGWVRSPVQTTAAQVASRIFLVWGVVERYEAARTSPLYATMVLAWSLTEVIRYAFYALSLLSIEPYPLLWLRYTTFLVLYPLGAGSEAFVNFATLPHGSPIPSFNAWARGAVWMPYDYIRGVLFLIWWPGLYIMYTYMLAQRRKVLGKGSGQKLGNKPKSQ
ncbi:PTPLA-domain-containing protein [Fomitiporia mediterranea MF3/22]|uniref:PTPLA-domain-containing protein n=1 Tax=Fomitiporia mediterranea (strain MF3/22) TaxID=694068 RepID=UPI000440765F|nr:PTPLA-domain-containing protein [Fomitiporia mediterranea MF3/22]EJD02807.1 PTPLA-domain-containing protein [Fomitiporia mediterranea MF3/22]